MLSMFIFLLGFSFLLAMEYERIEINKKVKIDKNEVFFFQGQRYFFVNSVKKNHFLNLVSTTCCNSYKYSLEKEISGERYV